MQVFPEASAFADAHHQAQSIGVVLALRAPATIVRYPVHGPKAAFVVADAALRRLRIPVVVESVCVGGRGLHVEGVAHLVSYNVTHASKRGGGKL